MPQVIAEDANSVTYLKEDGTPIRLPRQQAERLGFVPFGGGGPAADVTQTPAGDVSSAPQVSAFGSAVPGGQIEPALASVAGFQETPQIAPVSEVPEVAPPVATEPEAPIPKESAPPAEPKRRGKAPAPQKPIDAITAGIDAQAAAVRSAAESQAQANQEAADLLRQQRIGVQERDAAEARQRADEQRFVAGERARIGETMQKIQDTKIERARVFSGSTGNKIGTFIALALSGIGAAKAGRGGENRALDLINQRINEDVATQMANLDKQRGDVTLARQLLGDKMADFTDRRAMANMMRARYIEGVQNEMLEIQTRSKSDVVKANAEQAIGGLQVQKGQALQQVAQQEESNRIAKRQLGIQSRRVKLAEEELELKATRTFLEIQRDIAKDARELIVAAEKAAANKEIVTLRDPITNKPLGVANHRNPKQSIKDQDTINKFAQARASVAEYQQALREFGRTVPGGGFSAFKSQERADLEALGSKVRGDVRRALSGAQVNQQEMLEILNQIPEPRGLFEAADPAETLNPFIGQLDSQQRLFLRGRGIDNDRIDESLRGARQIQQARPAEGDAKAVPEADALAAMQDKKAETAIEGLETAAALAERDPEAFRGKNLARQFAETRKRLSAPSLPEGIRRRNLEAQRRLRAALAGKPRPTPKVIRTESDLAAARGQPAGFE